MEENKAQGKEDKNKVVDCDDVDPGVVIIYTDDDQIHRVLNLPAVAAGLLPPERIYAGIDLQPGATPAQSTANLKRWVDQVALAVCKASPCVTFCNRTRAHGLYHQMRRQAEHQRFIAEFTNLHTWTGECIANHISAGQLLNENVANK